MKAKAELPAEAREAVKERGGIGAPARRDRARCSRSGGRKGRQRLPASDGSTRRKCMSRRGVRGGGAGTRTPDTEIMILLLYQLSYAANRAIAAVEERARLGSARAKVKNLGAPGSAPATRPPSPAFRCPRSPRPGSVAPRPAGCGRCARARSEALLRPGAASAGRGRPPRCCRVSSLTTMIAASVSSESPSAAR